ncbi:PTS sugar transporter subunit IIB [Clostridium frigoris]|uniref:PTS sugar transporter subunit IIB n=1 Tax=Clostridium frigoris TaxID=205327 RepID=A0ABS6BU46_9CLOT|nr:PTS sugar transporter subunit IIB [Clostridium frigoris]MBU3160444.1 PTS sugar transporter subunit IIB [Clostridium frigoris]
MIKIALFCAAGMSTSLLVTKMEKAAKAKGLEVEIEAFPEAQMSKHLDGVAVALLGPQIRYVLPRAQKTCGALGIPVAVIASIDYGMMNGEKVLESALKLIDK